VYKKAIEKTRYTLLLSESMLVNLTNYLNFTYIYCLFDLVLSISYFLANFCNSFKIKLIQDSILFTIITQSLPTCLKVELGSSTSSFSILMELERVEISSRSS
jgi:hypothetical protein